MQWYETNSTQGKFKFMREMFGGCCLCVHWYTYAILLFHNFVRSILDLDPEKSLKSQQKKEDEVDTGPPLKEDPKYIKVRE